MTDKQCFTWSELGEEWIGAMYPWADVCIMIKAQEAAGGAAGFFDEPHKYLQPQEIIKDKLTDKEYKRFVELVYKINGITHKEVKERKEKGETIITVSEIKTAIEEVTKSVSVKGIRREDI